MDSVPRTLLLRSLALTGLALAALPAAADDRQLLRSGTGDPYVMILFDTSGSMNWSTKCTPEDMAEVYDHDFDTNGDCSSPLGTPCVPLCTHLCPEGDCPVPRDGDDPSSKFRQAKEALYTVLRSVNNVNFGFATFNQDQLRVTWKQWLYRVAPDQPLGFVTLDSGALFPAAGTDEVFGQTFSCNGAGCDPRFNPADTDDPWEMTKIRRLSRLGDDLTQTVGYYIRDAGQVYYIRTSNPAGNPQALGDPTLLLRTEVFRCTASQCRSWERTLVAEREILYRRIGDFVKWDNGARRTNPEGGFDGEDRSFADNTCEGWDPNTDTSADEYENNTGDEDDDYSLRFPVGALTHDPDGTANDWMFRQGDVLPLSWSLDQKLDVLNRLAPRLNGGPISSDPEAFAMATYLNDHRNAGENYLRLQNEAMRPIFPNGKTPLGYSLGSIRSWFRGCLNGGCPHDTGWDDIAATQDPDWQCRRKYLLVITDGDDTCPGRDPCSLTASMNSLDDITTFVVAFGVQNTAHNKLNCMASNGGSGEPIYAQNRGEFIRALRDIFDQIQEESVAFASAAVPTVQANIADKIYLSSFTPLNDAAVWPGRLDTFLKPIPTIEGTGIPDRTALCESGTLEAKCFAYDVGDSQPGWDGDIAGYLPRGLLLQAPLPGDITRFDNSTLQIGTGVDDRRVLFGLPDSTTPGKRQYFQYPGDNAEQAEFEYVWSLPTPGAGDATNLDTIAGILEFTLAEKRGEATDPETGNVTRLQYVMGDIFHANPTVVNAPSDFHYYTRDPYLGAALCGQDAATTALRGPKLSYAWFSNRNLCRRIMIFAGSNDGQLHAFDGGTFEGSECKLDLPVQLDLLDPQLGDDDSTDGEFNWGTGRELFSFIPEAQMPLIRELSGIPMLTTEYGIDNTPRVADIFIDPLASVDGSPTCTDREWRTVLLGTYREGGPGVFALDITQPDVIPVATNVPDPIAGSPAYVPSCINGGPNCGPLPFPALLWEFTDTMDEDANGLADLGETWSRPVVARIQVCNGACDTDAEPEDRYVAIFGGGISESPTNSVADAVGNWLYMVDVETGRTLYKRGGDGVIDGSVPADVALVDRNVNGLVDVVYFGTTAGFVYKLELGEGPFELGVDGRIQDPALEVGRFNPFKVFTTGGRPIYMEVNAVYVTKLRQHALLFGTGNRWNLWDFNNQEGRFYAIVDSGWKDGGEDGVTFDGLIDPVGCVTCTQPLTEAVLQPIDPDGANDIENPGPAYLFGNPNPELLAGWFFPLGTNEKLITEPVTISGISFFTFYDPISSEIDGVCARGGESKLFLINTANAVGYYPVTATQYERYVVSSKFTTQPFAELSTTQNQGDTGTAEEEWTDQLTTINRELRELQPATCRFANYTIDIKTIRSDTGIIFLAPVPVCIEGHNWKEY